MRARYQSLESTDAIDAVEAEDMRLAGTLSPSEEINDAAPQAVADLGTGEPQLTEFKGGTTGTSTGTTYEFGGTVLTNALWHVDLTNLHSLEKVPGIRIDGTEGNDVINGGDGDDELYGWGGDDVIDGGAGNDFLWGSVGYDVLNGGDGNDKLGGGMGGDKLTGGDGDDYLDVGVGQSDYGGGVAFGDAGNDTIYADRGVDHLYGGDGNDEIKSGESIDYLDGGAGDDILYGDYISPWSEFGDADSVYGEDGNDTVYGGGGNDSVDGGAGNDYVHGGYGDDYVHGGAGDDEVYGGFGNDVIYSDAGSDRMGGGVGRDVFVFTERPFQGYYYAEHDVITDFNGNPFSGDKLDLRQLFDKYTNFTGTTADQAWAQGYLYMVEQDGPGAAGFGTTVYIDPNGNAPDQGNYGPYDIAVVHLEGVSRSEISAIDGSFYGLQYNFLV